MRNIEIKTPLPNRAHVESMLVDLGAKCMWTKRQVDTFFTVERGWLKLRESTGSPPELISYQRTIDESGPRPSDYDILRIDDPATWIRALDRVCPIRGIVEKMRTLWLLRHTRVHLDRVTGLGEFLELETVVRGISYPEATREAEEIIDQLDLDRGRFSSRPYFEMLSDPSPPA